jgi:O-antigen/teichoic acid export membrane protein
MEAAGIARDGRLMDHDPDKTESVHSRYAVTLGAQVFRLLLSLISATIVPRALGPATYGNFSFLLATSSTLRGVLDTGTQQAFFTFSSQEHTSGSLTRLYALVLAVQFSIVVAFIGLAGATGRTEWLWHAQRLDQIFLVTTLDWLLFLALSLQQLGDSKGLTAYQQLIGAAVALLLVVGLLLLRASNTLSFYSFVWLSLAAASLNCLLLTYRLLVVNRALFWNGVLRLHDYGARWWRFTRPLILLQYYLPLVAYLGLYLIQKWYGSEEQGYYALALQWCAFAMVFTNSGVWIFWREIAHHTASQDLHIAASIYERFSRLFFFLALVLACWLSASSGLLVQVVAGERFHAAAGVLAIMAFYPVSQTLGQLTMVSLKAMERTASYARWSVALSIPDVLLTYFLLAPSGTVVPGLHLGAVGLALKTSVYGLVSVQVYDWLNCHFLGIDYASMLGRRIIALVAVGAIALAVLGFGGPALRTLGSGSLTALALSSVVYGLIVAAIVWLRPELAGLSKAQLERGLGWLRRAALRWTPG